jgi:NADH:ubiquinone oxidoreductase subunit F (NADH-binding)
MSALLSSTTPPRRLLDGPDGMPRSLAGHRVLLPPPPPPGGRPQPGVIELVAKAGLRGRGGAGFPTARKMRSVAERRGPRVVVANGTEGEPVSRKDETLLIEHPHLVIDGALWAAAAIGAERVVLAVERSRTEALRSARAALHERGAPAGTMGVELVETPPRYVAGEESALVHWLNGGDARPTTAPRPFERGVGGRPTLVQNVETLAHLALIATHGADWFRRVGSPDEPGTMLVTVTASPPHSAVLEAAVGTPLGELIARAGGARPAAVLVGGFFGAWLPSSLLHLPLSREALAAHGASPGAGVVLALPEDACGLQETARILGWYAAESAGQCGPCVFGLADLASAAAQLAAGALERHGARRLERWAAEIEGRGACHHPNGAVRLLTSALRVFAADVERHLAGSPCRARPAFAVPASREIWR